MHNHKVYDQIGGWVIVTFKYVAKKTPNSLPL